MKHIFFTISKITTGIALAALLTLVTIPSSAKSSKKAAVSSISFSPSIKYAGTDATGAPLIAISFQTPVPVKFEVIMADEHGVEFFSQAFESSSFSRYFKLVNETGESDMYMTVTIRVLATGESHSYKLASTCELMNTVVISKN